MVLGAVPSQPAWLCGVDGVAWTAGTQVLDMCQSLRASKYDCSIECCPVSSSVVTRASAVPK